ncbi:hypothetical protein [Hymenobacter weizhouensis]|uniref:hypothetical protein n=1 Tax=Hymenobacter sp. YIM 151500-1 TaxID=2987689 RepID=UPI0022276C6B|nr:hypothetical protein [Hymenobacter sp. YIM 151500-1]UYZ62361.1 hypothetical protein OIS53_15340 [Hymenobacter sp. YIM 151500-1]
MASLLRLLAGALLLAAPLAATSAPTLSEPDSLLAATKPEPRPWFRPRHLVLQTGGGLGMVAAGTGYEFWQKRTEVDVLLGFVPARYAGTSLVVVSAKLLYSPPAWTLPLGPKWQVRPLTAGAYISHTRGNPNDGKPGQYPEGYYWFSTNTRVGPLLGSRLTRVLPTRSTEHPRHLSFYYELSTNDLYLLSYFLNHRALDLDDIAVLSLGVKMDF